MTRFRQGQEGGAIAISNRSQAIPQRTDRLPRASGPHLLLAQKWQHLGSCLGPGTEAPVEGCRADPAAWVTGDQGHQGCPCPAPGGPGTLARDPSGEGEANCDLIAPPARWKFFCNISLIGTPPSTGHPASLHACLSLPLQSGYAAVTTVTATSPAPAFPLQALARAGSTAAVSLITEEGLESVSGKSSETLQSHRIGFESWLWPFAVGDFEQVLPGS